MKLLILQTVPKPETRNPEPETQNTKLGGEVIGGEVIAKAMK